MSKWPIFKVTNVEISRFSKWLSSKVNVAESSRCRKLPTTDIKKHHLESPYHIMDQIKSLFRLLSDKSLIDKSSKISSMGKFFSWNDLRSFYISECLKAFVKSFKIILISGKALEDLTTWRLFPSEEKNEKWRADSLKSLVQRNVQMTGALTEGVSTLYYEYYNATNQSENYETKKTK